MPEGGTRLQPTPIAPLGEVFTPPFDDLRLSWQRNPFFLDHPALHLRVRYTVLIRLPHGAILQLPAGNATQLLIPAATLAQAPQGDYVWAVAATDTTTGVTAISSLAGFTLAAE